MPVANYVFYVSREYTSGQYFWSCQMTDDVKVRGWDDIARWLDKYGLEIVTVTAEHKIYFGGGLHQGPEGEAVDGYRLFAKKVT